LIWADWEVVCDPPEKAWEPAKPGKSASVIVNRLTELANANDSVSIVSPYLLLSDTEIGRLKARIDSGMRVKILTNSMTSTDAIPVVAHYKGTRKKLLEAGIELYEVRPDAEVRRAFQADPNSKAIHGLHEKISVIGGNEVFIGTFNIDPRSQHLNTEVGILIHSEELGRQVLEKLSIDLLPVNSWRLVLSPKGKVQWVGTEDGQQKTFNSDPHASVWRRFAAGFLAILPIKGQL